MALELSELARKEIITSKSDIIDMRKALYDKLKRANKKAAGFPSSIGGVDTMFFDKKHTGPPAFEVVNLVVGVTLYIFTAPGNRPVSTDYTARNAQVAASLLQACHLAVIKLISGCVRIACFGLMITSLLQVVNRLDASWLSRLFIYKPCLSCFNNLQQVCRYLLHQVWFSQAWCNLMTNLHQMDKIHNLHQVCGVPGCVVHTADLSQRTLCITGLNSHSKYTWSSSF